MFPDYPFLATMIKLHQKMSSNLKQSDRIFFSLNLVRRGKMNAPRQLHIIVPLSKTLTLTLTQFISDNNNKITQM